MIRQIFIALLFLPAGLRAGAQTGRIVITVKNIQVKKGGELSTGLFLKPDFPKPGKQMTGNVKEINGSQMEVVFENVPAGTYAIVSFQDIDRDKDLKTNMVGYPTEPVGFSNNAKIRFGPPSFEDAQVTITAGKTTTETIILK